MPRHQAPYVCLRDESFWALCEGYHSIQRREAQRVLVAGLFEASLSSQATAAQRAPAYAAVAVLLENEALVAGRPVGRHRFNLVDQASFSAETIGESRTRVLELLQRHDRKAIYIATGSMLWPAIDLLSDQPSRGAPDLAAHVGRGAGGCVALLQLVDALERHEAGDPALAMGAVLAHDGTGVDNPTGVLVAGPGGEPTRGPLNA